MGLCLHIPISLCSTKKIVWKSGWLFSKPVPMQSRLASVSSENGLQTTGPRDHQRIYQNSTKVSLSLTFSFPSLEAVYKQLFLKGEVGGPPERTQVESIWLHNGKWSVIFWRNYDLKYQTVHSGYLTEYENIALLLFWLYSWVILILHKHFRLKMQNSKWLLDFSIVFWNLKEVNGTNP